VPRPRIHAHDIIPAAANVARLRVERGWSQTELAKKLEVSQSQIARMEVGKFQPTVEVLMRCFEVFGVTPNELFRPPSEMTDQEREIEEITKRVRALNPKQREDVVYVIDGLRGSRRLKDATFSRGPAIVEGDGIVDEHPDLS